MYKKCKQFVPCKAQKCIVQKIILLKQHCTLKKSGAEYVKIGIQNFFPFISTFISTSCKLTETRFRRRKRSQKIIKLSAL